MFDYQLFSKGYTAITRSGKKAHFISTTKDYRGNEEMVVRVEDYTGFIPYQLSGTIDNIPNPFDLVSIDFSSKVIGAYILEDDVGNTHLFRLMPSKEELDSLDLVYPVKVKPLKESKSLTFEIGKEDESL
jgi:hypothetical protein